VLLVIGWYRRQKSQKARVLAFLLSGSISLENVVYCTLPGSRTSPVVEVSRGGLRQLWKSEDM
jgi:hypothetical protein